MGRKEKTDKTKDQKVKKQNEKLKKKEKDSDRKRDREKDTGKAKDTDKHREKEKSKEKVRDKGKGKDKSKEKEKNRGRHRDRDKDGKQDKDKKESDKEKQKGKSKARSKDQEGDQKRERDKEREQQRDRSASSSRSSSTRSSGNSSRRMTRIWPLVVATGPKTFLVVPQTADLQDLCTHNLLSAEKLEGAWSQLAEATAGSGQHSQVTMLPVQASQIASQIAMTGRLNLGQGFLPQPLLGAGCFTGAALAQQQAKQQICFNFTGGKCFRENCRFLHIGPGIRQNQQPQVAAQAASFPGPGFR